MNHFSKWTALVSVFAICILIPVCTSAQDEESGAEIVETTLPQTTSEARTLSLVGHIEPWEQAVLYAKVSGYLEWIGVDKGSWVRKGDVLARIDVPEVEAELARFTAEAAAKQSVYDRLAKAQNDNADLVSPLEVDRAKGEYESALAMKNRMQNMVRFATIRAPYDGVITDRWVHPGALIQIATNSQSPTARIVQIMNFETVRIAVEVPETESRNVREGQSVSVRLDDASGEQFDGHVARIAWAINPQTRTMSAEIDVSNPDRELRPGMYAVCAIELEAIGATLRIPSDAIVMDGDNQFVWIVENGRAVRRAITVADDNGIHADIASGLTAHDQVVVKGLLRLSEGVRVNVAPAAGS